MTPREAQEYLAQVTLSWAIFLFGGLFVFAAIDRGTYIVEAFLTFLFGLINVYFDQLKAEGLDLVWTRRIVAVLWVLLLASRYLSLFQPLNFWAH